MDRSRQMRHANMTRKCKNVAPHVNGGTTSLKPANGTTETSSECNLSYHDISFHFKYEGNLEELKAFLKRTLPVASFASLQHDIAIDIENGYEVVETVDKLLDRFEIKGRRTIGLFGFYSIIMPSGPHFAATGIIVCFWDRIAGVLDPHNTDRGTYARYALVTPTGDSARVLQDGTTQALVQIAQQFCQDQLNERSVVPAHVVDRRTARAYVKEPDQSYQPGYQRPIGQYTNLPTAICEVGMSDVVSKVIFDCLTAFAGSKGKTDQEVGVDLRVDNQGLTRVRLIVFDTTITTLERLSSQNASVARLLRGKVDYRLDQLRHLRSHLHQESDFKQYRRFERQINGSIRYYTGIQRNLPDIDGEVSDRDVVRTCEILMQRAQVINMTMRNGQFSVTGIRGEELNGVALKTEAFLGLVGFQEDIVLDVEILEEIYGSVARACKNDVLTDTSSPIQLRLTRRHIKDELLQEFIASHNLNANQDFTNGRPITVADVKLVYLRYDTVITPAAEAYLGKRRIHSRALRYASALFWFGQKENEMVRVPVERRVYDLADLDRWTGEEATRLEAGEEATPLEAEEEPAPLEAGEETTPLETEEEPAPLDDQNASLWSNNYTNIYEWLDSQPTTSENLQYFRRLLDSKIMKDLLDSDKYKRALVRVIRQCGSLTEFIQVLGEDEKNARGLLLDFVTGAA